jgi:hypothetical protein
VLRQGATEKRYAAELEEGVNELVIDVANPVATSPTLMLIPREAAIHRGVLAGRCEGIAGLSELRVEAGLALSGGAATLRYDAASFAFCGDGLTGSPADDPLHIAYGYVDGLTAFRVPWRNDIETTLAEYGARQNMIVTGQNYNVSSDFAPDITDWREVPGTRYISNFNPDGTRIAAVSPTQAFPLKMTLLGRGIQVYPGISQDAIYAGEEPFRAEFELLWGPAVAASAIPNRATFEVSRPGFWSRNANAAPWNLLSGLPLKPPNSSADGEIRLDGATIPRTFGTMRQVTAVAGHGRDPGASTVSLATGQHGRLLEVVTHDDGVYARLFSPAAESLTTEIDVRDVDDAVVARRGDGLFVIGYVQQNRTFFIVSQAEGTRWSDPQMIAPGEEVALAVCSVTGRMAAAIYRGGIWRAYREDDGIWAEVGAIVSTAEGSRAGLAFANDDPNALVFAAPLEGVIRTFESTDFGTNWEEV